MSDKVFLAGSGIDVCTTEHPSIVTATGGGGTGSGSTFDNTYAVSALAITVSNVYAESNAFDTTGETEVWFHFECRPNNVITGHNNLFQIAVAGTTLFRFRTSAANVVTVEYWDGSAFQSLSTMAWAGGSRFQIDVQVIKHASAGEVRWWYGIGGTGGQTLGGQVTDINTNAWVGSTIMRWGRSDSANTTSFSQMLACNFNTITAKVKQTLFTSTGAVNNWSGGYADIDEAITSFADLVSTDTAAQISTYKSGARTLTGFSVRAVMLQIVAFRAGNASPANLRGIVRIGGVNYNTSDIAIGYGRTAVASAFYINPSTGLSWTVSDAGDANLELGFESRT